MKPSIFVVLLFSILFSTSCQDSEGILIDEGGIDMLQGKWSDYEALDSKVVFKRVKSLPENKYGIEFKSDHKVFERKNEGWCATPPVSFTDVEGT